VSVNGVSKSFRLPHQQYHTLKERALHPFRARSFDVLQAVKNVSVDVGAGEFFGIVGRNGSGKSTLLKCLAGIYEIDEGELTINGRLSPFIELGVGFNPELPARDNVIINAIMLGLSRKEAQERFDDIVAFAELENFIETPVKFYSSGMFVRLGFSVAIEADPDILLVDEVLAVGDFAFQLKCYDRMQEIRRRGTTVIVVSHNLGALRAFCDRGVVMHGGRAIFDGPMFDAIGVYHEVMAVPAETDGEGPESNGLAEILDARLSRADGSSAAHVDAGDELNYRVTVRAHADIDHPFATLVIGTEDRGICVYSDSNARDGFPPLRAGETASYDVRFTAAFPTGSYTAKVGVHRVAADRQRIRLGAGPAVSFYTTGRTMVGGLADLQASFTTNG
jgi:ABC-type polysaccharide/polyol phosphate transport system ATPase subunit